MLPEPAAAPAPAVSPSPEPARAGLGIGAGAALLVILAVATFLRFSDLDWGLVMPPHNEERLFVGAASDMLAAGDLNHRFYEYGGAFVYLISGPLAFLDEPHSRPGFLVARMVVAACGVLSVLLTFVLGRRLCGTAGGLAAAALAATGLAAVRTAHGVRPDVALEPLVLLTLLELDRLDGSVRRDVRAGLLVGAATAMKFTGAFLGASWLAQRLARCGWSWTRPLLAFGASLAGFALLTPYAVLNPSGFAVGVQKQARYHYVDRAQGVLDAAAGYARLLTEVIGPVGLLLALVGVGLAVRERRRFASLLAFPVVLLAVLVTSDVGFERFLVPITGIMAVLAGRAVAPLAARSAAAAAVVVAAAMVLPLRDGVRYLAQIREPGTRQLTREWLEAHVPPGARIAVTTIPDHALDGARYEIVPIRRLDDSGRLVARHADVVVARAEGDGRGARDLDELFRAEPRSPYAWRPMIVGAFPAELRPSYEPVPIATVEASSRPEAAAAAIDGDVVSSWWTGETESTLTLRLAQAGPVARVTLVPGERTPEHIDGLTVQVSDDGRHWRRITSYPVRPALSAQYGPRYHVLAWKPVTAAAVRLVRRRGPWGVAEVELGRLTRGDD